MYRINGVADHIHIMSDLHPSVSLADYIKNIKVASSLWMKESSCFHSLNVGKMVTELSRIRSVIEYVKNQKVHHRSESFYDEYKRLLNENGVKFDERYLL